MRREIIYLLILTTLCSCNQPTDKMSGKEQSLQTKKQSTNEKQSKVSTLDFSEFEIMKGRLGEIKIGMTISEVEQKFDGLRREEGKATSFGYGGGSPAYLYYDQENVVFGLIPTLSTDTVLLIIAASPKLKTTNGLTPNSTVKKISENYPQIEVNQDLMNGWEYISDTTNNWDFVFMTDEKKVGDYPELEVSSDLKNLNIKADWITIK